MSEGSNDAAILIATSYQALIRTIGAKPDTLLTDCSIVILFAGFFVEASLNYIFESLNIDICRFPLSTKNTKGKSHPGMNDKLQLFYNEFIEQNRASNWEEIKANDTYKKAHDIFPNFKEIWEFRNDLSHGKINESAKSLASTLRIRQNAKNIVDSLYSITSTKGYNVPRLTTYREAMAEMTTTPLDISADSSS